jgi:hypothetical protein
MLSQSHFTSLRNAIAGIPGDVSNDAVGDHAPKQEDIFAPETHASALDPSIPVVLGSRGAGKSFWSGVLGRTETRRAAAIAYPRLGLGKLSVAFGFTGAVGGPDGISIEQLNDVVPANATSAQAKTFWWATILTAAGRASGERPRLRDMVAAAAVLETRESMIDGYEQKFKSAGGTLLVVYDALDAISTEWPRRRLLTEALFETVWAMRAYSFVKLKVFLRPDQIDDDALKFVEIPKLRTGAVRLQWTGTDLYGLLFSRLAQSTVGRSALNRLALDLGVRSVDAHKILERKWPLVWDVDKQAAAMAILAGPFMAPGPNGFKKGKTYDWPIKHLSDAHQEVTPRSFLGLMIGAAKYGSPPADRSITPDGIRHGLRTASKTRVDQLHLEFPWIKGVLAPLSGLLLPQEERQVYRVWNRAGTVTSVIKDAQKLGYLPPFESRDKQNEQGLYEAMNRIGVMSRRLDNRLDMPDLFRVAARLLKKGATAPLTL